MDCTRIGQRIYTLRREKHLTQKQLADMMRISDKTISKWECGGGCPDISLLPELTGILGVSMEDLLEGDLSPQALVGGNMKKSHYYVCPLCGNVSVCTGEAQLSCCGRKLDELIPQKADSEHALKIDIAEDEWFITSDHPMLKDHYIAFLAFATGDRLQLIKQYPEWNLQQRLPKRVHGTLYWYCTHHGLFYQLL